MSNKPWKKREDTAGSLSKEQLDTFDITTVAREFSADLAAYSRLLTCELRVPPLGP